MKLSRTHAFKVGKNVRAASRCTSGQFMFYKSEYICSIIWKHEILDSNVFILLIYYTVLAFHSTVLSRYAPMLHTAHWPRRLIDIVLDSVLMDCGQEKFFIRTFGIDSYYNFYVQCVSKTKNFGAHSFNWQKLRHNSTQNHIHID